VKTDDTAARPPSRLPSGTRSVEGGGGAPRACGYLQAAEADMATQAVEKELLKLEKQYWQAIKDRDVDTAMRLTDDPCIVTGAQGVGRIDKKALAAMMKNAPYTLRDFEVNEDVQVRLLRDDVAVLAYKVHEELTVDGKPVRLDAAESSTWVRRDAQWVCAAHTESIEGDAFGRDRRAPE
jgi:hypothetical protein